MSTQPEQDFLSLEALQDLWSSNEDDIHINLTNGHAYYNQRLIVPGDDDSNPDYPAIWQWMQDQQYWPNIWEVNDHGNIELVSIDRNGTVAYHGGLV